MKIRGSGNNNEITPIGVIYLLPAIKRKTEVH
jgi:hypothetical protein